MKTFYTLVFFLVAIASNAQQIVSGTILDEKSKPIVGANIFIDGTYDGSTSDENGNFKFTTTAIGNQVFADGLAANVMPSSLPQAVATTKQP